MVTGPWIGRLFFIFCCTPIFDIAGGAASYGFVRGIFRTSRECAGLLFCLSVELLCVIYVLRRVGRSLRSYVLGRKVNFRLKLYVFPSLVGCLRGRISYLYVSSGTISYAIRVISASIYRFY